MGIESRLSLRQLRAFAAVYRLHRLADAAGQLSVTPSAVSVLIRQIESGMGVQLFDRHARALRPTQAAHDAIGRVERILAEVDRLGAGFQGLRERSHGRVHLVTTPAVGAALLPEALRRFGQQHPRVEVVLEDCAPNQFVSRILSEQVEFGIGTPEADAVGVDAGVLVDDRLCVVCPRQHPLAACQQVRWAQLKDQPIIAGTAGYGVRRLADAAAARAGVALRVVGEVNFLASALWRVAGGLGIAIFPAALVVAAHHPDLVLRPLVSPRVMRTISVVTRQGISLSPAAQGFVDVLRQSLSQPLVAAKRGRRTKSAPADSAC